MFIDAPLVTTDLRCRGAVLHGADLRQRCRTRQPANAIHKQVHVNCPNNGNAKFAFPQTIRVDKGVLSLQFCSNNPAIACTSPANCGGAPCSIGAEPDNAVTVSWPNPAGHDIVRGSLNAVRTAAGNYTGTDACQVNNGAGNAAADATAPAAGTVLYYLVRAIPPAACSTATRLTATRRTTTESSRTSWAAASAAERRTRPGSRQLRAVGVLSATSREGLRSLPFFCAASGQDGGHASREGNDARAFGPAVGPRAPARSWGSARASAAAYLSDLRKDPFFSAPALDAELHDYWARGLAFGAWGRSSRTAPIR